MNLFDFRQMFFGIVVFLTFLPEIRADFEPVPQVVRLQPGVLRQGETATVTFHGTGLETLKSVDVSRNGVRWKVLPVEMEEKSAAGSNPRMPNNGGRMMAAQGAPGSRRIEFSVPAREAMGWIEVRLMTEGGASNTRKILISDGPAVDESEPNNDLETAQDLGLGAVASGFLTGSNDVDYYKVNAKKGQRLSAWLGTTSTDSRLPGAIEVYDSTGSLLASARDKANEDAWAELEPRSDGPIFIRVFSFGYVQGGPDSFYLLKVSAGSRVEAVFPPIASANRRDFTVYGRGLAGGAPVRGGAPGLQQARSRISPLPGGPVPNILRSALVDFRPIQLPDGTPASVAVSSIDPTEENPDNDTPDKAMNLKLPALVAGRIEKAADRDWYQFEAKKGEPLWIEVLGDRLGTDLDFMMVIKGEKDTQGREIDEGNEPLHPQWFFNRSEDPGPFRFVPPQDGIYKVMVSARDGELEGGPHLVYALRIDSGNPDFKLFTLNGLGQYGAPRVKPGSPATVMVLAARMDGFDGPIDLAVEGLPRGTRALPSRIEGGQKLGTIVVESTGGAGISLSHMVVTGRAVLAENTRPVRREARHAGLIWPGNPGNNNPYPVRIEEAMVVTTSQETPAVELSFGGKAKEIVVEQGDKLGLSWQVKRNQRVKDQVQVTIGSVNQQDIPYRVANGNNNMLMVANDKTTADFQLEVRSNARAGTYFVVPRFQANVTMPPAEGANAKAPPKTMPVSDQGQLVTLIVIPKKPIQQLSVTGPGRGEAGGKAKLPVKIERQGFQGTVKLVSREEGVNVVVPADATEAVLDIQVPQGAKPGFSKQISLKAICEVLPGRTVEQDAKIQFNLARP